MNQQEIKTFSNPWYFLAQGFGSGLSRFAPGTVGTLVAVPFYFLFRLAGTWGYIAIVLAALVLGVWLCDKVGRDMQIKDPGSIVWDEFVGLWITLFMLPEGWPWLVAGFLLFRIFDITKPWPVGWLDKNLEGGLGIMMDDVAAGLYSLFIIQIVAFGLIWL